MEELRRLNWALAACASATSALVHGGGAAQVMTKVCEAIVGEGVYLIAAVGLPEATRGKPVRMAAVAGPGAAYFQGLDLSWSENSPRGRGPAGIALRSGNPRICPDSLHDPAYALWKARGLQYGIRSNVAVPFSREGKVIGALLVYADQPGAFGPDELRLFHQLGDELAFAIGLDEERLRLERAEASLRESEARYRSLFDHAPDGLIVIAAEGAYIDINPSACAMLGYEREDFIGLRGPDLVDEEDLPFISQAAAEIQERGVFQRIWRLRRKDGSRLPAEVVTTRMPNGAFISIVHDITERERTEAARLAAEDALRETQSQLARVGRAAALGEVVATIAHEINQPLAAISTHAGAARRWLARTPPNLAEATEALTSIARDARRASEVIRRTRAFLSGSRSELTVFDLNDALSEVIALARWELRRGGISVSLDLAAKPLAVHADRPQIQQVALNLVLNAIDALAGIEDRPRRLGLRTARVEENLQVSIEDNGEGLDPAALPHLFERFHTTKAKGTGMGLAISRSIVEAHDGRIWALAAPGHGTLFRFTLPAALPGRA